MASEIIEVVFENVELEKAVDFLLYCKSKSILRELNIASDSGVIDFSSKEKLIKSIIQSSDGAFYFSYSNFYLGDFLLAWSGVRLDKYNGDFDVLLDFEEDDIIEKIPISQIHLYASKLSSDLQSSHYYCGYEPAQDTETRFFTQENLGPLSR